MPAPETPSRPSLEQELALLTSAATEAGEIALDYFKFPKKMNVQWKGGTSPVSEGDFAVDAFLSKTLLKARPDYGWLSEETADDDPAGRINAPRTYVVDPIDGTRAYISGKKTWCVSAALVEGGKPIAGILVCPALGETYAATVGKGAMFNGKTMPRLDDAPYAKTIGGKGGLVDRLAKRVPDIVEHERHIPSLAYRIAMVASGRLGGTFVRQGAHDWDIAAAMLVLTETGCVLRETGNGPVVLNDAVSRKAPMVASHPDLLEPMIAVAEG